LEVVFLATDKSYKNLYSIIDVETTGGKYNQEGITEIAIYKFDGEKIIDQFISLINPEIPIQPYVQQLTGINDKMLVNAPKFFQIAKRILEITEDSILVAHNSSFDYRMIKIEFERLGYDFNIPQLCTVKLSKKLIPDLESYKLGNLVKNLGIPISNRHRASGDALATVELFKLLLSKDLDKEILSKSIINKEKKNSK
jgi:DNA polymerase-3 subunit epsilon